MMYDVQFSKDGVTFTTLISYSEPKLAEALKLACAGWSLAPYWRVTPRADG